MGQSTDAVLAFGYALGDEDGSPDWAADFMERWIEVDDDDEFYLQLKGWTNPEPNPYDDMPEDHNTIAYDEWRSRTEAARTRYNVADHMALRDKPWEMVSHCSVDYPMWILSAPGASIRAYRGDVVEIDPKALLEKPLGFYITQLERACELLGLKPDCQPKWLLVSDWG